MKYIILESKGFKYAVPGNVVAEDRAKHYSDESPTSYDEEYKYTMESDFELTEWFFNNMNWDDVKDKAVLIGYPTEPRDPMFDEDSSDEMEVKEMDDNLQAISSANPFIDNRAFQRKYEFDKAPLDKAKLQFRNDLLKEEFEEIQEALETGNAEEWVDGHVDLLVIAIGNLHLAGVDVEKAWGEVYRANMSKVRGIKPGREQSGGFDVIKPEGWVGPSHEDNHGQLEEILSED